MEAELAAVDLSPKVAKYFVSTILVNSLAEGFHKCGGGYIGNMNQRGYKVTHIGKLL